MNGKGRVLAEPRGKESVLAVSGHGEGTRPGAAGERAGVIAGEMVGGSDAEGFSTSWFIPSRRFKSAPGRASSVWRAGEMGNQLHR